MTSTAWPDLRLGVTIGHVGRATLMAGALLRALREPRKWLRATIDEMHRQGFGALPLVVVLTALGGAITSQQTGYQFEANLPLWIIGSVVAASSITELAPLLTGLAVVGIVGARIAAELGSMKVTQQVDALEMIGRDPILYLVVPRVLAGFVVTPLLTAIGLGASLVAGWWIAVLVTPVTSTEFIYGMRYYARDFPFFFAVIKGAAFGLATTFIACYVGLQATGGSRGVGRSTTAGVVAMITAVILLDALLAPLLKLFP